MSGLDDVPRAPTMADLLDVVDRLRDVVEDIDVLDELLTGYRHATNDSAAAALYRDACDDLSAAWASTRKALVLITSLVATGRP